MAEYHPYVFDTKARKFVGKFEEMYRNEKKRGFDSWQQDDLRHLDRQICLNILEQYNFNNILDVGCGKGAFTQFLKKQNNLVMGLDISSEALLRAKVRYPDIEFIQTDVLNPSWYNVCGGGYDLIVCMEILSYIENWPILLSRFSILGEYSLIKLFIPDQPIGFVKSIDQLLERFAQYYSVIENIHLVNRRHYILFGRSLNHLKE